MSVGTFDVMVYMSALSDLVAPTSFTFTPPVEQEATVQKRALRYSYAKGVCVYRLNGVWAQSRHPDAAAIAAADRVYFGGRKHFLTYSAAQELIAAGYNSYVQEIT